MKNRVRFVYEVIGQLEGQRYEQIVVDDAGSDPTNLRTHRSTINFQGFSLNTAVAVIESEAFDPTTFDFWAIKHPEVKKWVAEVESELPEGEQPATLTLTFQGGFDEDGEAIDLLPYMLLSGIGTEALPPEIEMRRVRLEALFYYDKPNGPKASKTLTWDCTLTNGQSGEYESESGDAGEVIPIGLASWVLSGLSQVHYQGSYTITEKEVGDTRSQYMGCVLNLTGGRAEWVTMNALIQQVSEDWTSGSTTLTFGPALHLGLDDYLDFTRNTRQRVQFSDPRRRTDDAASNGALSIGGDTPNRAAGGADADYDRFVVGGKDGTQLSADGISIGTGLIRLLRGDLALLRNNAVIKFRIVPYSERQGDGSCLTRKIIIPCSEVFD